MILNLGIKQRNNRIFFKFSRCDRNISLSMQQRGKKRSQTICQYNTSSTKRILVISVELLYSVFTGLRLPDLQILIYLLSKKPSTWKQFLTYCHFT